MVDRKHAEVRLMPSFGAEFDVRLRVICYA